MKSRAALFIFPFLLPLLIALLSGCATSPPSHPHRAFDFQKDTLTYPNELLWQYGFDTNGHWTAQSRDKRPKYALHCFVVARSAAQFFKFARFDPQEPVADEAIYRKLVRKVLKPYPNRYWPDSKKIVIPGYADLRSFSAAHESLLKKECGGMMQSYFQRGHWRMVLPFTHRRQQQEAERLVDSIQRDGIAVVHLVKFPSLGINHAIALFAAREEVDTIQFSAYDPNDPSQPMSLSFDRASRTFRYPRTQYFPGGSLKVYQVYHRWNY